MQKAMNGVVLVNGIGHPVIESVCHCFARNGAKLVVVAEQNDRTDALVSAIKAEGGTAIGVRARAGDPDDAKASVAAAVEQFGKVDVLLNDWIGDISQPEAKTAIEWETAAWNSAVTDRMAKLFAFSREAALAMRENKYGRVVNLTSLYYLGWPGATERVAAYSAAFGFTRSMALESAKDNITVNCLAVGDMAQAGLKESETAKLTASIPMKRLGQPQDIQHAIAFLASERSKYITGQTLFVCGGKSIHFSMSV
ncbi:3-ketoacyl-ACP reductase [Desulfosarcina ovata subsp. sediminis]|uniref:3-ketoacyl-ACP reductase n=1 Tax=Desulfosarcina ovata subsp. sediminis TaxID=885957 RepID=A0A5K7ZRB0_9BACT|nr:SDR family oxidoreductase [Desulfosarcina ovata]BBO80993.1 3-ketoacyl-ACP reductase [Desulfosarcina ovata subsp. sediminis]